MKMRSNKYANAVNFVSVGYLLTPAILFCMGWLNLWAGILLSAVLLFVGYKLCREYASQPKSFSINPAGLAIVFVIVLVWCWLSGIGGFSFQNSDYFVRNPIYRDLYTQAWPVVYDLSAQKALVQQLCGSDKVLFVYYFAFWLPPAALTKLFHGGRTADILLYLWTVLGVMLVFLQVQAYSKASWLKNIVVLIFFSGLDVLPYMANALAAGNTSNFWMSHMEWWAGYFQYSSNTTLLYWVFNQAVPVWLIVACLLNLPSNKNSLALTSLSFLYSPFATFGMIPLAIASVFMQKRSWRTALTWSNVLCPLTVLLVWGSFYLSNSGSVAVSGFAWTLYGGEILAFLILWIWFLMVEIGFFFVILFKKLRKYDYLAVAFAELALFPLYRMTPGNDFVMRGSIPALFVLAVSCIKYLEEEKHSENAVALALVLLLGAATPTTEILRSVTMTCRGTSPNESIYSFDAFATDDTGNIALCDRQFFAHGYEDSFFYKYLGKDSG